MLTVGLSACRGQLCEFLHNVLVKYLRRLKGIHTHAIDKGYRLVDIENFLESLILLSVPLKGRLNRKIHIRLGRESKIGRSGGDI